MPIRDRWWALESSRYHEVGFTRSGDFSVLTMGLTGRLGVIGLHRTEWYSGNDLIGAEGNLGLIELPRVGIASVSTQLIAVSLRRRAVILENFAREHNLLGGGDGTFYVVLLNSERKETDTVPITTLTVSFCFTADELIPDFEGVVMQPPKVEEEPPPATPKTPVIHRISRYERKWVI